MHDKTSKQSIICSLCWHKIYTRIHRSYPTDSCLTKIRVQDLLKSFIVLIKWYGPNLEAGWHQSLPRAVTVNSFLPALIIKKEQLLKLAKKII
jgi:hypothetical protein